MRTREIQVNETVNEGYARLPFRLLVHIRARESELRLPLVYLRLPFVYCFVYRLSCVKSVTYEEKRLSFTKMPTRARVEEG